MFNFWHSGALALRTERQSARMSKIKHGGLDQYGAEPLEQQQLGTAGVKGVNVWHVDLKYICHWEVLKHWRCTCLLQLPHSFDSEEMMSSTSNNHFMLKSTTTSSSGHRRSRTDVKKCRKVYGIENRAMWCTQCKWKKACNRFQEHHRPDDIN